MGKQSHGEKCSPFITRNGKQYVEYETEEDFIELDVDNDLNEICKEEEEAINKKLKEKLNNQRSSDK